MSLRQIVEKRWPLLFIALAIALLLHFLYPSCTRFQGHTDGYVHQVRGHTEAYQHKSDTAENIAQDAGKKTQKHFDASDFAVTQDDMSKLEQHITDVNETQDINERFEAAKRKPISQRMASGNMGDTNKKRRRLLDKALRREFCKTRTRTWRQEYGDTFRGDNIPKAKPSTDWGMMKLGNSDPSLDLHPGAMGPLSGMKGKWNSDSIPVNTIDDMPVYMDG